jgi:serine/threonine protein kinase
VLSPGTKLGPYEILSPLGVGGMGEVYRARDTRLDRTVAIKVLSSALTVTPELKARFEREARAISALNHPNICHLYDVGSENGADFLVMEFLEGESLADRLRKGPLPVEQLLKIAIEITDALDKAHHAAIIHRDLKPGNIMLTKSGAKLLDFGLAKPRGAMSGASPSSGSVFSAALTQGSPASPLSTAGTILGTVQYMSPEQIAGSEADVRSDIFTFGIVLYEMATGKRAFEGKTQASVAGAILAVEPPPVRSLQPAAPAALDSIVRHCLAKDPDERFQSIHDVKLQLQLLAESPAPSPLTIRSPKKANGSWISWTAVTAALAIAIAEGFWISSLRTHLARKSRPVQSALLPGDGFSFQSLSHLALSPDGRKLAVIGLDAHGQRSLWVRDLGSLSTQQFADTENAIYPFWSPDGRYIAFFADRKLKKVDSAGGPTQVIADASNGRGGTWSSDSIIVFAPETGTSLFRVSAAGGQATEVSKLDRSTGFNSYRFPQFLPDGRHFIFLARGNPDTIKVGSLDGSEPKNLLLGSNAAYTAGYLLFMRQNSLMAQRFDADRLQLEGDPVLVAASVAYDMLNHRGCFTVAADALIYQTGTGYSGAILKIADRAGKEHATIFAAASPTEIPLQARFSPDGERIAAHTFDPTRGGNGGNDIWIDEPARNLRTRFTFDNSIHFSPVWSPDGSQIVFNSNQKGHFDLYIKPSNLSQPEQPLLAGEVDKNPEDWSRDGKFLIYSTYTRSVSLATGILGGLGDLWVLPFTGDRKPFVFLSGSGAQLGNGRFSPDGRWVAYQSNASGSNQIYITSFPDHHGVWQVSNEGGTEPVWGAGGKELFFLSHGKVYVSQISFEQGAPQPGIPTLAVETPGFANVEGRFDVSRDGKKFLFISDLETTSTHPLTLFTNWTSAVTK